jgi:hypothetical protein
MLYSDEEIREAYLQMVTCAYSTTQTPDAEADVVLSAAIEELIERRAGMRRLLDEEARLSARYDRRSKQPQGGGTDAKNAVD